MVYKVYEIRFYIIICVFILFDVASDVSIADTMASDSRELLGKIARKLDQTELTAAIYLCGDLVPDPKELNHISTAFELMDILARQKVIDVDSNDWHQLVKILDSKVVRRKDLAKLVSQFGE